MEATLSILLPLLFQDLEALIANYLFDVSCEKSLFSPSFSDNLFALNQTLIFF